MNEKITVSDERKIVKLYRDEKKTIYNIAKFFKVCPATILKKLRKNNISIRQKLRNRRIKDSCNKDKLEKEVRRCDGDVYLIAERPIITYADITRYPGKLPHDGTLYKAANFEYLGLTGTNYRYLTKDGKLLHKRAIWERAKRNNRTEKQQSEIEDLVKFLEWPKKIFIYR